MTGNTDIYRNVIILGFVLLMVITFTLLYTSSTAGGRIDLKVHLPPQEQKCVMPEDCSLAWATCDRTSSYAIARRNESKYDNLKHQMCMGATGIDGRPHVLMNYEEEKVGCSNGYCVVEPRASAQ